MFPFCKKSLTPAQRIKNTVSQGVGAALDSPAADKLAEGSHHLLDALHEASGVASHKLHDVAALVHDTAATVMAHTASTAAQGAAKAQEAAHALAENAVPLAAAAQQRAGQWVGAAQESGRDVAAQAQKRAARAAKSASSSAHDLAGQASDTASDWGKRGAAAATAAASAAAAGADRLRSQSAKKAVRVLDPQVEIREAGSKWLWLGVGLAVGAVLALIFAPTSGRRSRAVIHERLDQVGSGAADALAKVSDGATDVVNRAQGLAEQMGQKLHADESAGVDDDLITDRVRSALGHVAVSHAIERLNINTEEGVVILRGPAMDEHALEILEKAARAVPGVKDVRHEHELEGG